MPFNDCPKPEAGEFGEKFVGGSEMKGVDAEAGRGDDIFAHVVDEHGFFGQGIEFTKRVVVDHRRGLACPDMAGINAHWKMAHKRKSGFHMRHVDGVGVGKQGQAAGFGEALKQRLRQESVPGSRTLFQIVQNSSKPKEK